MFHFFRLASALFMLLATGCSLSRFAADQAGGIAAVSSSYMRGFWDYEIARSGTSSGIMQLESMHSVSPENEQLSLTLASMYVGYGFGWVELDMDRARADHKYDQADRFRQRAELLYRRARDLALATMRERDDGITEALKGDPKGMQAYLKQHYPTRDDLAPVFWTASAWGSMLNMSDQMDDAIDLPLIRTMIEHVVAIDPAYESATGLVFLGGIYAQTPPDFGGDPAKGKAFFERALELTKRRSRVVQLNYAKLYALTTGDQKLFRSLLDEVLAPEDQGNDVRLSNKIARMHAELLLQMSSPVALR